mmetsp:Transcript_9275/g.22762  ORF Transcript_9275/g.22762 Transcript_9275/m.22762 type:complete len:219 (-) Transcript_9275:445-1101(-)
MPTRRTTEWNWVGVSCSCFSVGMLSTVRSYLIVASMRARLLRACSRRFSCLSSRSSAKHTLRRPAHFCFLLCSHSMRNCSPVSLRPMTFTFFHSLVPSPKCQSDCASTICPSLDAIHCSIVLVSNVLSSKYSRGKKLGTGMVSPLSLSDPFTELLVLSSITRFSALTISRRDVVVLRTILVAVIRSASLEALSMPSIAGFTSDTGAVFSKCSGGSDAM